MSQTWRNFVSKSWSTLLDWTTTTDASRWERAPLCAPLYVEERTWRPPPQLDQKKLTKDWSQRALGMQILHHDMMTWWEEVHSLPSGCDFGCSHKQDKSLRVLFDGTNRMYVHAHAHFRDQDRATVTADFKRCRRGKAAIRERTHGLTADVSEGPHTSSKPLTGVALCVPVALIMRTHRGALRRFVFLMLHEQGGRVGCPLLLSPTTSIRNWVAFMFGAGFCGFLSRVLVTSATCFVTFLRRVDLVGEVCT